ncbi:MAG TPA: sulfite exporter TauE/SafE family protein [Methylomusa anaerophila]|uniref:Nickel/cobalt efflux system n=1 Tax=Methylomusa anaerophila TaxID=1930071 RepID=A0A348AND8_9FIRM|nr:sulfite exporter TauE/SafE family protein [Methylomusa anaerophila]BBB92586.1 nickel/cobalt efflux protein RcnA [Methylomusa anaerophila]HML87559.1 sulfite exporter TauE/SafE family protein [Methylomusa anaerophila]
MVIIVLVAFFLIDDFPMRDQVMYHITNWQAEFNKDAAIKIKVLSNNYSPDLFQALFTFSFLYGVLHATSPGHGKSIIAGWILTQQRHLKDIALVAIGATFLHAFSAVAIVAFIFYFVGNYFPGIMRATYLGLNVVSGATLIIAGFQLLGENYKQYSKQRCKTKTPSNNLQSVHPVWIALSIGIIPCPLAAAIFIYCMTTNMVVNGLLLVAAFALGMGLTLFVVAITVWLLKNEAMQSGCYHDSVSKFFLKLINVISALFFIVLGILIILTNIQKAF